MKKVFLIMLAAFICLAACKEEEISVATSVELVSVTPASLTLEEGDRQILTAEVSPETAADKSVRWTTADASKVIVSETGEVTALAIGSTIITATSTDGGKKGHCNVTVTEKIIHVETVTVTPTAFDLLVSETTTLTATVLPGDATDATVMWSSSDETIATVDSEGLVTAVAAGSATITATSNDDNTKTADCMIRVIAPVTSVSVEPSILTIAIDDEPSQLTATVLPGNATDKTVAWSSSNNNIATVNSEGLVTAVAEGSATITATTTDGGHTATCAVTVKASFVSVSSVSLDKNDVTLHAGETATIVATVLPVDADDKTITWETSNASVATVSDGAVTTLKPGTVTITARSHNNKTAACTFTVKSYMLYVEGRNSGNNRTNTYIDFGTHAEYNGVGSGSVTIEFWGKYPPVSSTGLPTLIGTHQETDGAHRGWFLNANGTRLRVSVGTSTGLHEPGGDNLVNSLPMSDWHHYAFVYNTDGNGAFALYVDGALIEAHDGGGGIMHTEPQLMTAFINPLKWGDRSITGWMKKLRVWNTAKTEAELNTLKNTDVTGNESDLVAAWDFTAKPASNSNIPSIKNGDSFKATINGTITWEEE